MTYNNYGAYNGFGQNQGMGYPNQMFQQNPQAQFQQQYQQNPQAQIPPSFQQNTQVPQIQQPVNQFEWVSGGEMEATAYPLAPGHSVILMDSENPVIYLKTRESNGKYLPMEIYDLVKREKTPQVPQTQTQTQIDLSAYVRKDDLGNIIAPLIQEAVDKALAN